jgi:hypothetical protein
MTEMSRISQPLAPGLLPGRCSEPLLLRCSQCGEAMEASAWQISGEECPLCGCKEVQAWLCARCGGEYETPPVAESDRHCHSADRYPEPTPVPPVQISTPVSTKSRGLWKWLAFAMLCVAAFYWFRSPAPSPQPVIAEAVAKRPYYGMTFAEGSQDGKIYIGAVEAKGPAANAGLAAGDQVVALDGLEVSAGDDFKTVIAHSRPEHGYQLEVRRGNRQATGELIPEMIDDAEWSRRMSALQKTQLVAVLSSPPAPPTIKTPPASAVPPAPTLPVKTAPPPKMRTSFGMSLRSAPYQNEVNVVSLYPGGRAETAGIELGDIVMSFDGISINVPEDMLRALDQVNEERPVAVVVYRGGKTLKLSVRPEMIDEAEWRRRSGNK